MNTIKKCTRKATSDRAEQQKAYNGNNNTNTCLSRVLDTHQQKMISFKFVLLLVREFASQIHHFHDSFAAPRWRASLLFVTRCRSVIDCSFTDDRYQSGTYRVGQFRVCLFLREATGKLSFIVPQPFLGQLSTYVATLGYS